MDEIIAIVGKVLAAAVVALFAYLVPKIKTLLEAKIGSEGTAKVLLLIENFVTAADQLYKADDPTDDPTGVIRKKYVEDQLKALGYAITDELNGFIESAVKKCNKEYNK